LEAAERMPFTLIDITRSMVGRRLRRPRILRISTPVGGRPAVWQTPRGASAARAVGASDSKEEIGHGRRGMRFNSTIKERILSAGQRHQ
jgi:hypothetical protein